MGSSRSPATVDVVVVGGGLAGALVALGLARGGARVLLCEARGAGQGASARSAGLLLRGLQDHASRLAEAVGPARAAAIEAFTEVSLASLAALVAENGIDAGHRWPGGLRLALDPTEAAALEESSRFHPGSEVWTGPEIGARTGLLGFVAGLWIPGEGVCDAMDLVSGLLRAAESAGVSVAFGTPVRAIEDSAGRGSALRVMTPHGVVAAELAVLAGGAGAAEVEPWLRDKVVPVRTRLQVRPLLPRTDGSAPWTVPPHPVSARFGYEAWRWGSDGSLTFQGCRWAALPEMEFGESDDTRSDPRVDAAQDTFLARHIPGTVAGGPGARRSIVESWTCDGLPVVGPIPGARRRVACTGWNGRDLTLAPASARHCVDAILGRPPEPLPEGFTPSRLV